MGGLAAAFLLAPSPASANCAADGTTLTCTGDLSNGVFNPRDFTVPPVENLVVRDLTADISPAPPATTSSNGIFYRADFSTAPLITLDVDLGNFVIQTTRDDRSAIGVGVTTEDSALTMNVTGDIFTASGDSSFGILAATAAKTVDGSINLTSSGIRETTGFRSHGIYGVLLDTFLFGEVDGQIITFILEQEGLGDGTINITHDGRITTLGDESPGVRGALGVGDVLLDITSNITTGGQSSDAIVALIEAGTIQITSAGTLATSGDGSQGISASFLGGGEAQVSSQGNISTQGFDAGGVEVISLGNAVIDVVSVGDITTGGGESVGIRSSVDGDADINITSTGAIMTTGFESYGIATNATGNALVNITSTGDITTGNGSAVGIISQVTGDGEILISSDGDINTSGDLSHGIFGRSDGAAVVGVESEGAITTSGEDARGIWVTSVDGAVGVNNTGDITVTGATSEGIVASSVNRNAAVFSTGAITVSGGDGIRAETKNGTALISSEGDITAGTDAGSSALVAAVETDGFASITSIGTIIAGRGASAEPGLLASNLGIGDASITARGSVNTQNDMSHALFAGARGGNAFVFAGGTIEASGANADAIHVEAAGGFIAQVVIDDDSVIRGGTGDGAAVAFFGTTPTDAADTFLFIGQGAVLSSASGLAIYAEDGNDIISNNGTVIGNVFLGNGDHLFENLIGARFEPGDAVGLGVDGTLNNFGTIAPFGEGVIGTTLMNGDLVLQPEGILAVDIMSDGSSDILDIVGSAELGGLLDVNALGNPGDYTEGMLFPLLATTDGVTGLFAGVQDNLDDLILLPVSADGGNSIVLEARSADFSTLPNGCAQTGSVITCTGNVPNGAAELGISPNVVSPSADTLVVRGLTGNVTRSLRGAVAFGLSDFTDDGITLDIDLGTQEIFIDRINSFGIAAFDTRGGDISITSQGTIRLRSGDAIAAEGEDETNIAINHTGNLFLGNNSNGRGIFGRSLDVGNVDILMRGDITLSRQFSTGIVGVANHGNVTIDFDGTLLTQGLGAGGLLAIVGTEGHIDMTAAGIITRGPLGGAESAIEAVHQGDGNISITNNASISEDFADAIVADIAGDGDITITNRGAILKPFDTGISATVAGTGNILIDNNQNLIFSQSSFLDVINARVEGPGGSITIINRGNLLAEDGIFALTESGRVVIDHQGDIDSRFSPLLAIGKDVEVTTAGTITSQTSFGRAISIGATEGGSIALNNQGNITITESTEGIGIGLFVTGPGFGDEPDMTPVTLLATNVGDINITKRALASPRVGSAGIVVFQEDQFDAGVPVGTGVLSQTGDITVNSNNYAGIILGRARSNEQIADPDTPPSFPSFHHHMDMTVDMTGTITAMQADSFGIRSIMADGTTAVFNLAGGTITGGSGVGAGIVTLESEATSTHTFNIAADMTVSAVSGWAFIGGAGREEINLSGTLDGLVDLGAGNDTLTLFDGAVLTGLVDGGDGDDELILSGDTGGTFDVSQVDGDGTPDSDDVFTGFGALVKSGAGDWTLTGTNTDALFFNVTDGTVLVNGNLPNAAFTVETDGRLGGIGTTGSLQNNGAVAPGNSIGTLTVNGNYVQTATGALLIEFGPTGQSDLLDIAGTADLNGTLDLILFDANVQGGDVFTFLIADGGFIDDSFDVINTPSGLDVQVTTVGNQINVEVVDMVLGGCVQTGSSVLCSGIDPDGFDNTVNAGLGVRVEADAQVLNPNGDTLSLGDGAVIDNLGVVNSGAIGIAAGNNITLTNSGVIMGTTDAIAFSGDGSITNDATGTITGDNEAIDIEGVAVIVNRGTITGRNGTAIAGGDQADIVVNSGTINGDVLLGGGDDTFTTDVGTGTVNGMVDGGDDTDTLALTGTGAFDLQSFGMDFVNFERLALGGGADITATGTSVDVGTFDIGGNSTLTLQNATLVASGGVNVGVGSTLGGTGIIDGNVTSNGTVSPGLSPGTLTINGNYDQSTTGTLLIEFGPTGQTDLLDIAGTADLDGALDLILFDPTVSMGDVFTVLIAGGGIIDDTFDMINTPAGLDVQVTTVGNQINIEVVDLVLGGCVQTGLTVLCSGIDPDGFNNTADAGLDVLVEADVLVNNPDGNGLTLGNGSTTDNLGVINVGGNGINAGNGTTILNRDGAIIMGDANGIVVGDGSLITNDGTIQGEMAGVRLSGADSMVENRAGGVIAGAVGITSDAAGQTVTNRAGARIEGGIALNGGDNVVALETGSLLTGGLDLTGGAGDTLRLFGAGGDLLPVDIDGVETLLKTDTGLWALNDDLAVEETRVEEGTLIVGGLVPVDDDDDRDTPDVPLPVGGAVLTSPLVDVAGGTLGGHGMIIGDVTAREGGRIGPGASIGVLAVEGNVAIEDGGVFDADLNDAGAHDRLAVTAGEDGEGGTAALGGRLNVVLDGEFVEDDPATPDVDESRDADGNRIIQADFSTEAQVYDVIVADGGVNGTFQQVGFEGGPNDGAIVVRDDHGEQTRVPVFKGFLHYLPDRVQITSIPDLALMADTANQSAIATALDADIPFGLSDDPFIGVMAQIGLSGDAPNALDDLSPEWYTAFHEVAINVSRSTLHQAGLRAMEARHGTRDRSVISRRATDNATVGASADDTRASFWISANYDTVDVDASDGYIGYDIDTLSGYVGFDYLMTDQLLLGIMGGFGDSDVEYDGRSGSGDVDSWQIAGYASFFGSRWFVTVAGGYGALDITSSRDVTFGTVDLTALADYDGEVAFFSAQAGYSVDLGNNGWQLTPEIGIAYVDSDQDGFAETGAGPVNLVVDAFSADSLRLSGQLRLSKAMRTGNNGWVVPYVRVGVAHELEDDLRPITAAFEDTTGAFTVFGRPAAGTTALFGAGISGDIASGISLFVDYAGELSGRFSSHNITGGARIRF